MQTIGIIGTGEIGWRMGRLFMGAGHPVVGYDIRAEALQRPEESGFEIAPRVRDLCENADIVITCVTDGEALRSVVFDEDGVAETLKAGRPLIDTTSAEPWITQEIAQLLASKKIPFLDAPVSGGVPAAEAGRMNFMVGGDPALLEQYRPLLEILGSAIAHVGAIGSGHAIKAINMLALASSMLATAEALAVGLRSGLKLEKLVDSFEESAAASYCTHVHFPCFVIPGNYNSGFSFDLMLKDLSIGIGLADRLGVPLFLERTTFELYRALSHVGLRGEDNTRVVESLVTMRPVGQPGHAADRLIAELKALVIAANTIIGAEAICLGAAAGIGPSKVIEVLAASSGDNHMLTRELPDYLETGVQGPALRGEWSVLSAGLACIPDRAVSAPLISQAVSLFAAAHEQSSQGGAHSVFDLIVNWTGQARLLGQTAPQGEME